MDQVVKTGIFTSAQYNSVLKKNEIISDKIKEILDNKLKKETFYGEIIIKGKNAGNSKLTIYFKINNIKYKIEVQKKVEIFGNRQYTVYKVKKQKSDKKKKEKRKSAKEKSEKNLKNC